MNPLEVLLLQLPEHGADEGALGERWCPSGSHWLHESSFRLLSRGKLARDCKRCETRRDARIRVLRAERLPMNGVDIDRIHYTWRKS